MASSFPSISQTLAYFESPNPAKLAAEKKARQDALAERLRILAFSGPPNVSSSPYEAEVPQASPPEVPPRPARKREARENPSIPETILPLVLKTPQSQSQVNIATLPLQKPKSKPSGTRSRILRLRLKA